MSLTTERIMHEPVDTQRRRLHLKIEEGWFSFFLLAFMVYSVIWCIQRVDWVNNLGILTTTTGVGLVLGLITAKLRRVPRFFLHTVAIMSGVAFAAWQTTTVALSGRWSALLIHIVIWVHRAMTPNGTSSDDTIFLLFLAVISFFLGYLSSWLTYRTRRPWLAAVANGVVLLINLNYSGPENIIFLIFFLVGTLLLLMRFTLAESIRSWRRLGLRFSPDLGWDFMQAGAIFTIGVLLLSWLLPTGNTSVAAQTLWETINRPWIAIQNRFDQLMNIPGGNGGIQANFFGDHLTLTGTVNLPKIVVLDYTTQEAGQYLVGFTYDHFDGHTWTSSSVQPQTVPAGVDLSIASFYTHTIRQDVHLVNPPLATQPYLFGASEPVAASVPMVVDANAAGNVSWAATRPLQANMRYTMWSAVSSADPQMLRAVPLPANAPKFPNSPADISSSETYDPALLALYLQLPADLSPNVAATARRWTQGATNMYDMAVALETHLRTEFTYSTQNPQPPANEDAVDWFLQQRRGFCTFFATTMAIMARTLGMPARVANGFTDGVYDPAHHDWVVHGTDAHTWTQIYFAGYGWINFEPSATFPTFTRPAPGQYAAGSAGGGPTNKIPDASGSRNKLERINQEGSSSIRGSHGATHGSLTSIYIAGSSAGFLFFLFALATACWIWLFRHVHSVQQAFGRLCRLASWAGLAARPSQTPYEYLTFLRAHLPQQGYALQHLGDLYVRLRWGSARAAPTSDELREMDRHWEQLRHRLFLAIVARPRRLIRLRRASAE
jgi:transglutaminase-like putative cysteine protease